MKILYLYTFKDHTIMLIMPHISLTFFQQDIKHIGVYKGSVNFSTKKQDIYIYAKSYIYV